MATSPIDRSSEIVRALEIQSAFMIESDTVTDFLSAHLRSDAGQPAPAWPEHWKSGADIDFIRSQIAFHGIQVLLAIRKNQLADWPSDIASEIADEARLMGLWEETHKAILVKLLETLATANTKSVLMKGTALAYSHYPDPAMRRRGDTDLLVREKDLEQARASLRACGFERRQDPHGLYFQETWLYDTGAEFVHSVDLHWEPTDRPVLQKVLRIDEYLESTVPLPRLSPHAFAPNPVLTLIQIAFNQEWHRTRGLFVDDERVLGGWRLIWSADYDLLARGFVDEDWDLLVTISNSRNAGPLVHDALARAAKDLSTPVPDTVMSDLQREPDDRTIIDYLSRPDQIGEFEADLQASSGFVAKSKLLFSNLFPSRDHLISKYPERSDWPTVALQFRRLTEIGRRVFARGGQP
ncbi:MAG: nucleotidyltransferase family protein [Pseudomonadota bacterium]